MLRNGWNAEEILPYMEKWVSDRPDLMIEKVWVPEEESREITLRQLSGRKRGAERNEATRKAHLKSQYAL